MKRGPCAGMAKAPGSAVRSTIVELLAPLIVLLACAARSHRSDAPSHRRNAAAPSIKFVFHFQAAKRVVELFDHSSVSDTTLDDVLHLQDVQAIIQQAAQFDPRATGQEMRRSLRTAVEGGERPGDLFQFQTVRVHLAEIRTLLGQLEARPESLSAQVADRIRIYSPRPLDLEVDVHFVLGGNSDGWAPKPRTFYLALQYFGADYEGLKTMMAHELFHVAQREFMAQQPASPGRPNVAYAGRFLAGTMSEGTASMVGDPLRVSGGGTYIKWFRDKFERNLARIDGNFALFEIMLYRVYHDSEATEANLEELYKLGFSGTWDSPLYFVGYRIGKAIEKYDGAPAIARLLEQPPTAFFLRYMSLYRQHPDDAEFVHFSRPIEEVLGTLHRGGQ